MSPLHGFLRNVLAIAAGAVAYLAAAELLGRPVTNLGILMAGTASWTWLAATINPWRD